MNLLNMLLSSMTSSSSLEALSGKTDTSSSLTSSLVSAALPMLMGALTNNASSEEGASSLLHALSQHTDTSSMASQLANADIQDGNAIIGHILGQNTDSVVQQLSDQTGANAEQVTSLLGNIAPAMMSGLSAAATSAHENSNNTGLDFSGLLSAFGGGETAAEEAAETAEAGTGLLGSLISSLTGGNKPAENTAAQTNQSQGLTLTSNSKPSGGGLGSLLSGLFSTDVSDEADAQEDESAFDGSNLLASLLNLMQ